MRETDRPAAENIRCLEQGAAFIEQLDDRLFTEQPDPFFRGGVGGQFRHCIDFYSCLLRGLDERRVDYTRRGREARVETERATAAARMRELAAALREINHEAAEHELDVLSECQRSANDDADADVRWTRSTLQRELQFLASHTIHHFALIISILVRLGWQPQAEFTEFGIAPSTLEHWKRTETAVG